MPSKSVFAKSQPVSQPADAVNMAGLPSYSQTAKHELAVLSITGTFNQTFYTSEKDQIKMATDLVEKVSKEPNGVEFIAKCALYSKKIGKRKDYPLFLLAWLSTKAPRLFEKVFNAIIWNGKALCGLVQIIKSGVAGRKGLGYLPRKMIRRWLLKRDFGKLLKDSVGSNPSLAQVIGWTRPKPASKEQETVFGYLRGREVDSALLPEVYRQFEDFKRNPANSPVPDVDFRQLTGVPLSSEQWKTIFLRGGFNFICMNLNTAERHGLLKDDQFVNFLVQKLSSSEDVRRSGAYPHKIQMAIQEAALPSVDAKFRYKIRAALWEALEISLDNVPDFKKPVVVFTDISGSMETPVTGIRQGATTMVTARKVAELMSAAVLRKNPVSAVVPFQAQAFGPYEGSKSIEQLTDILAKLPSGGTDCAAALRFLNEKRPLTWDPEVVLFFSDNESNIQMTSESPSLQKKVQTSSELLKEWDKFKKRNPKAKLICVDLAATVGTQAPERGDILNIAGWNDHVFTLIDMFVTSTGSNTFNFVDLIENMQIPSTNGLVLPTSDPETEDV